MYCLTPNNILRSIQVLGVLVINSFLILYFYSPPPKLFQIVVSKEKKKRKKKTLIDLKDLGFC